MAVPIVAAQAASGAAKGAKNAKGASAGIRPYSGGSRRNVRLPHEEEPAPAAAATPAPASAPAGDDGPAPETPRGRQSAPSGRSPGRSALRSPGGAANDGAGVVLGFLLWVWVVLPFIDGGPTRVKAVLSAKFLNRTSGENARKVTPTPPAPSAPARPDFGGGR